MQELSRKLWYSWLRLAWHVFVLGLIVWAVNKEPEIVIETVIETVIVKEECPWHVVR